jgi:hypothetical protein
MAAIFVSYFTQQLGSCNNTQGPTPNMNRNSSHNTITGGMHGFETAWHCATAYDMTIVLSDVKRHKMLQ